MYGYGFGGPGYDASLPPDYLAQEIWPDMSRGDMAAIQANDFARDLAMRQQTLDWATRGQYRARPAVVVVQAPAVGRPVAYRASGPSLLDVLRGIRRWWKNC